MSHGLKKGDSVKLKKGAYTSNKDLIPGKSEGIVLNRRGSLVYIEWDDCTTGHSGDGTGTPRKCWNFRSGALEKIDVEKRSFRNGDIIKVFPKGKDARAYLKMGDAYYNLSTGGYLKPSRTLPRGPCEVVVNLSGMGDYFLMPPDQVMREREDLVRVGDLVEVTDTKDHSFEREDIVRCVEWEEGDIPLFEREDDHLKQHLELNQFEILDVDE